MTADSSLPHFSKPSRARTASSRVTDPSNGGDFILSSLKDAHQHAVAREAAKSAPPKVIKGVKRGAPQPPSKNPDHVLENPDTPNPDIPNPDTPNPDAPNLDTPNPDANSTATKRKTPLIRIDDDDDDEENFPSDTGAQNLGRKQPSIIKLYFSVHKLTK